MPAPPAFFPFASRQSEETWKPPTSQPEGEPDLPRLLSAAEVAAIFGRSTDAVYEWVAKDRLRPVRIGRSLFFHPDEIRQLIVNRLTRSVARGGCAEPGLSDARRQAGGVSDNALKYRAVSET